METIFLIIIFILGVIEIIMIIKFFQIASDVRFLKTQSLKPKSDFKIEFYKWIAACEQEKAKEVLFNEIGCSDEFAQLFKGGNEKYLTEIKDKIRNRYKEELSVLNFNPDLDNWI